MRSPEPLQKKYPTLPNAEYDGLLESIVTEIRNVIEIHIITLLMVLVMTTMMAATMKRHSNSAGVSGESRFGSRRWSALCSCNHPEVTDSRQTQRTAGGFP